MIRWRDYRGIALALLLCTGASVPRIASGWPRLTQDPEALALANRIGAAQEAADADVGHIPALRRAQQVHLAHLGGSNYSLAWVTPGPLSGAHVRYQVGDEPEQRASATSVHRSQGRWSGHFHEARIEGLGPGLTVHYQLHDDSGPIGATTTFDTEPKSDEFFVIAWGDLGVHERSTASVWMARWEKPSLLIHAGDLSYANGRIQVWDQWFRMIEPLASRVPYMTAPGNHEYESLEGPVQYLARMALPGNERFYRTRWGSLDLVFLDTNESAQPGTPQGIFIEEALAAADSDPGRWKVVVLHKPPYSSSFHGSNPQVQAQLSPMLDRYDVDLLLAGHDHNYERTWPIWANRVLTDNGEWGSLGTLHVVTGTAGRPPYAGGHSEFTARQASRVHYTRIHVSPTSLKLEAVGVPSGEIFDLHPVQRTPCLAEFAAGTERRGLPHLRDLRDEILSKDDAGVSLTERFYRHSPEIVTLASTDPAAAALLSELVQSIGEGTGELGERWALAAADVTKGRTAIEHLSPHASPSLANELSLLDGVLANTTGPTSIGMVLRRLASMPEPGVDATAN